MNMRFPPQELAGIILKRSRASVRVGAVIWDRWGIFAWGWNHEQDGKGLCAERHAILRANPRRFKNATISVEGRRKKVGSLFLRNPAPTVKVLRVIGELKLLNTV